MQKRQVKPTSMNRKEKIEFLNGLKNGSRSIDELIPPLDYSILSFEELLELHRIQTKVDGTLPLTSEEIAFQTEIDAKLLSRVTRENL